MYYQEENKLVSEENEKLENRVQSLASKNKEIKSFMSGMIKSVNRELKDDESSKEEDLKESMLN